MLIVLSGPRVNDQKARMQVVPRTPQNSPVLRRRYQVLKKTLHPSNQSVWPKFAFAVDGTNCPVVTLQLV